MTNAIIVVVCLIVVGNVVSAVAKSIIKTMDLVSIETKKHNQRLFSKRYVTLVMKKSHQAVVPESSFYFMEDIFLKHVDKMLKRYSFLSSYTADQQMNFIVDNTYIVISTLSKIGFNFIVDAKCKDPTIQYPSFYQFDNKNLVSSISTYFYMGQNPPDYIRPGRFITKGEYYCRENGLHNAYLIIPMKDMVRVIVPKTKDPKSLTIEKN